MPAPLLTLVYVREYLPILRFRSNLSISCLYTGPWGLWVQEHKPITSLSSVQHSLLLGLRDASTVDLKARCSGAHPSDAVLKVRVLNVGEAPGFEFPPKCASLRWSELYCRIASASCACFGCGFFFLARWEGYTASLQVLFRRNDSRCSCRFGVSMGGGEFRI